MSRRFPMMIVALALGLSFVPALAQSTTGNIAADYAAIAGHDVLATFLRDAASPE